jgi:hypothetical protein
MFKLLGLIEFKTAVFLPPSVERLFCNTDLPASLYHRLAFGDMYLSFTKLVDDLLCRKSLPLHLNDLLKTMIQPEYELCKWIEIKGSGHLGGGNIKIHQ